MIVTRGRYHLFAWNFRWASCFPQDVLRSCGRSRWVESRSSLLYKMGNYYFWDIQYEALDLLNSRTRNVWYFSRQSPGRYNLLSPQKITQSQSLGLGSVCYESMWYIVCPGSSDPFYMVTYYIKWVTTYWTHSTSLYFMYSFHLIIYTELRQPPPFRTFSILFLLLSFYF